MGEFAKSLFMTLVVNRVEADSVLRKVFRDARFHVRRVQALRETERVLSDGASAS